MGKKHLRDGVRDIEIESADREDKTNRDRAYTYLKEAVNKIRSVGRYVFRRDPARVRGYASEYLRKHRGGVGVEEREETVQAESAASAAG